MGARASSPPRRLMRIAKPPLLGARSVYSAPKVDVDCEAPWERGASAPLIIAFFLIVVFYAPYLLIGVCVIGYFGWVRLIVWV